MRFGLRTQFLQQLPQNLNKNPAGKRINISANGFHHGELPFFRAFLLNKRTQGFDMVATENPDCRIPSTAESPGGGGWIPRNSQLIPLIFLKGTMISYWVFPWCFLNWRSRAPLNDLSLSSKLTTENNRIEPVDSKLASSWTQRFRISQEIALSQPLSFTLAIFNMSSFPPPIESSFCLMMFHMIAWTVMVQLLQVMDLRNELFSRGNLGIWAHCR